MPKLAIYCVVKRTSTAVTNRSRVPYRLVNCELATLLVGDRVNSLPQLPSILMAWFFYLPQRLVDENLPQFKIYRSKKESSGKAESVKEVI